MTTNELIKQLQAADPEGTAHVRMPGGIPVNIWRVEGYFDGPYTYIDENGNYVTSMENNKVDIWCMDMDDYIFNEVEEGKSWEEIKAKLIFKFTYAIKSQREEREAKALEYAKKQYDEAKSICDG